MRNRIKSKKYVETQDEAQDEISIQKKIVEQVRTHMLREMDMSGNLDSYNLYDYIKSTVVSDGYFEYMTDNETTKVVNSVYNEVCGYDILQELLDDDSISEIMVNGYKTIFVEKNGKIVKTDLQFESEKKLLDIIQKMVSDVNRIVNEATPIVDARLQDGSRINVVLPPIAIDGPILTIRKFFKEAVDLMDLVDNNTLSKEAAELLIKLVKARYNLFIAGGTSSGKTTLLNALSKYIPKDERIITIEDAAELKLNDIPNLVRLEVRLANAEGKRKVTIRDLIRTALRMAPSRILVGEVRNEEALELLDAYNTGHEGSISTGHANSCIDMISRFESMIMMGADIPINVIREKIASSIDVIIYLGRVRDKSRKVLEISEIKGCINGKIVMNKLYEYKEDVTNSKKVKGKLCSTGNQLIKMEKLNKAGIKL